MTIGPSVLLLLLGLTAVTAAPAPSVRLESRKYTPLPVGSITPSGWLLTQLQLQADGLSGHLAMFWPDVAKSVWIGGGGDGGLNERTPYWLNGIVPLAYLLRNAKSSSLTGAVSGIWKLPTENSPTFLNATRTRDPPASCAMRATVEVAPRFGLHGSGDGLSLASVDLLGQVECYIEFILSHQHPDGWLGPVEDKDAQAVWGRSNVMLALAMYAEAVPANFAKVVDVMLKYALNLRTRVARLPLTGWAQSRWQDIALGVQWLLDNAPQGREAELIDLLHTLHSQGSDWETWFDEGTFASPGTTHANGHNVNNAQALKSAAVLARFSGNASLPGLSLSRVSKLDAHCGLPTGMYVGDEIIPPETEAGDHHHPSRGIELCGVVEAMFSYSVMFGVFGHPSTLDKAERIAFNALPATWASPTGGDMWAHQYLQAVNQMSAVKQHPHIWTHDGDDAERYGLAPNYGCCTANFNQGWPKFAQHTIWLTEDGGAAVGILAPVMADLPASSPSGGGTVQVLTEFPFGDIVKVVATAATKAYPLYIRVPGWAGGDGGSAELVVNNSNSNGGGGGSSGGTPIPLDGKNGTLVKIGIVPVGTAGPLVASLTLKPKIRIERWSKGGYSVHRGALMFSLPVTPNYTVVAHNYGTDTMSNDYDVNNASAWGYALQASADDPAASLTFVQTGTMDPMAAPFNHTGYPVYIKAKLRSLPGWPMKTNSADVPPASPACAGTPSPCGAVEDLMLVPHGATDLRIGMFPLA